MALANDYIHLQILDVVTQSRYQLKGCSANIILFDCCVFTLVCDKGVSSECLEL